MGKQKLFILFCATGLNFAHARESHPPINTSPTSGTARALSESQKPFLESVCRKDFLDLLNQSAGRNFRENAIIIRPAHRKRNPIVSTIPSIDRSEGPVIGTPPASVDGSEGPVIGTPPALTGLGMIIEGQICKRRCLPEDGVILIPIPNNDPNRIVVKMTQKEQDSVEYVFHKKDNNQWFLHEVKPAPGNVANECSFGTKYREH